MDKKILNILTSSISEVKRSPMDIFKRAAKEDKGVYIFNREKIAGVMVTQKQYEAFYQKNELLQDYIIELIAEKRLLSKNTDVFSDSEVRGAVANDEPFIDELDSWE